MKLSIKSNFPLLTLGAGGLGLCLRMWLLRCGDEQGLLPEGHIAGILCFILFALVMGVLFLCSRTLTPVSRYNKLFPASLWGALGCVAGTTGIVYNLFAATAGTGVLQFLFAIISIAAAGCLVFTGYCRLTGRHPSFLFHCVITVYFMLHLVLRCRLWGAQPQLQIFFFPFLGAIFLLLTAYQRTTLDAGQKQRQWYVLFNQAAVFCCLLAAAGENKLFYLTMSAWVLTNLCSLQVHHRQQRHTEEA